MATIWKQGSTKVTVYTDHLPPHCHVLREGQEVKIALADLGVIDGAMDSRHLAPALDWLRTAAGHAAAWQEWRKRNPE